MAISKFLSAAFGKKGMGGEGLVALRYFLNLRKKRNRNFNFQSNEPYLKFIWASLPQNSYLPPGLNLQRPPTGGLCRHRSLVLWTLNYLRKNGCLKICIAWVWGKKGVGGLVALPSLLNLKKWNRTYNFYSIELSEFYFRIPSIRTIYAPWAYFTTLALGPGAIVSIPDNFFVWPNDYQWLC